MLDILPNSIPNNPKVDWSLSSGGMRWLYLFCANCGALGGRVLETDLPENYAFYLCGEETNNCVDKWGDMPGTFVIPDEAFFAKVKQAEIEEYGRNLNPVEQAIELGNEFSVLSKLKREYWRK